MSIIRPGTISPVSTTPDARLVSTSAASILANRVLAAAGGDTALKLAASIHHDRSGLVVTGAHVLTDIRSLRAAHPHMVLVAESSSSEYHATEMEPFILPTGDGQLFPPSLDEVVAGQRDAGASVVLLPAGYLSVGAEEVVRAVIERAREIRGDDIVVPLYLDEGWLKAENLKFLRAAIARSAHPVAVAFGSKTNPLSSEKRLLVYRALFAPDEASDVPRIAWRTDFAGIDAMTFGAHAAVMGVLPSQRRITPPSEKGKARNPKDRSPYVIIPGALHFKKAGAMRTELFAGEPAPNCPCFSCHGRPIDRFTRDDVIEAHLHNLAMLDGVLVDVLGADGHDRRAMWADTLKMALLVHADIARRIGRPFNPSQDVAVWADTFALVAEPSTEESTSLLN